LAALADDASDSIIGIYLIILKWNILLTRHSKDDAPEERMDGESAFEHVIVDDDDSDEEVSTNLPRSAKKPAPKVTQKPPPKALKAVAKSNLFDDDDADNDIDDKLVAKPFSDDNTAWLKLKGDKKSKPVQQLQPIDDDEFGGIDGEDQYDGIIDDDSEEANGDDGASLDEALDSLDEGDEDDIDEIDDNDDDDDDDDDENKFDIEKKADLLDAKRRRIERASQAELQMMAKQQQRELRAVNESSEGGLATLTLLPLFAKTLRERGPPLMDENDHAYPAMQQLVAEAEAMDENAPENVDTTVAQAMGQRVKELVAVLSDFARMRNPAVPRAEYTRQLQVDFEQYFGYSRFYVKLIMRLFNAAEALAFFEANEKPRPVTLRANTLKTRRRDVAVALQARGVHLDAVGEWTKVGLQVFDSQVPLGATPEYLAGHYMLQSAASFLPVMALDPQSNERVLDLCAAPGGKSTYIAAAMRNSGVLYVNDVNETRLNAVKSNLARMGVKNSVICCYDGRKFPKMAFDRILVDAPCAGLGVVSRDPSVKFSKTYKDVVRCAVLQKELLLRAIDLCDHTSQSGGIVVYSTCSISIEENEAVIDYALRKRDVQVLDAGLSFGDAGFTRYRDRQFDESLKLSRRVYPHKQNLDGFFICKLKKLSSKIKTKAKNDDEGDADDFENNNEAAEEVEEPVVVPKKKKKLPKPSRVSVAKSLKQEAEPKKKSKKFFNKNKGKAKGGEGAGGQKRKRN
jgi:ribosomal RNA methyltransferase Nop2